MKVLVTGAGGFLGRRVVARCAAAGYDTLALYRPGSPPPADNSERIEWIPGDLREKGPWCAAVSQAQAIIHCAAAVSGELAEQLGKTLVGTENLLAAASERLSRFVHVSSFSVYDYGAPSFNGTITEGTPLEAAAQTRDAYTTVKLAQEAMIRDVAKDSRIELVVIRPGMIYGPGKDWDFGRALRLGTLDLIFSPLARLRLTHVNNCADAIVAAVAPSAPAGTFNIVDSDLPTHWGFHRRCKQAGHSTGIAVPVPYLAVKMLGALARLASVMFFAGRARLPEVLDSPRQRARWRPLRYDHRAASAALSWHPRVRLAEGVLSLNSARSGDLPSESASDPGNAAEHRSVNGPGDTAYKGLTQEPG